MFIPPELVGAHPMSHQLHHGDILTRLLETKLELLQQPRPATQGHGEM